LTSLFYNWTEIKSYFRCLYKIESNILSYIYEKFIETALFLIQIDLYVEFNLIRNITTGFSPWFQQQWAVSLWKFKEWSLDYHTNMIMYNDGLIFDMIECLIIFFVLLMIFIRLLKIKEEGINYLLIVNTNLSILFSCTYYIDLSIHSIYENLHPLMLYLIDGSIELKFPLLFQELVICTGYFCVSIASIFSFHHLKKLWILSRLVNIVTMQQLIDLRALP